MNDIVKVEYHQYYKIEPSLFCYGIGEKDEYHITLKKTKKSFFIKQMEGENYHKNGTLVWRKNVSYCIVL